jgi:metal transporter CNNM
MYFLYPVAYPVAKLLDHFLGISHGMFFDRNGLKTLLMLHERLNFLTNRLNREEVTVISSVLDLHSQPVSAIMTPFSKLYTLPTNQLLDAMTRSSILSSGYDNIPVLMEHHPTIFVGILSVKSLGTLDFVEDRTVAQMNLESMLVVRPGASCQEMIRIFRDREVQMVLVMEKGAYGELLGIVTARDLLDYMIGGQIENRDQFE